MIKNIVRCLVVVGFLALNSGCGVIDYYFLTPPEDTARELVEAGNDAMQAKEYGNAIEYYTKLKDRYPFSPFTPEAELKLGDAYFLDEQFRAASETYREFEALHPRHEAIPYVLFQIGLSGYKQFETIDLPQQSTAEALEYFRRVVETYPGTPYAVQAQEYIVKCRRHQAEYEIFVADFYWRTKRYKAAWQRYSFVAEEFPEIEDVREYAMARGKVAYLKHQEAVSTRSLEAENGSWKQYFDWL
ncbi:MAG TPA: outer membrane protein assembly factor BamD [Desulfomicrobiaceae bacterium]|nr:outer membrane protein assembly factor BamD [Desulfomicrobiaceae bacterium]